MTQRRVLLPVFVLLIAMLVALPLAAQASGGSYIGQFQDIKTLASTVPSNGDVNPYGVVVVPRTVVIWFKAISW